MTMVQSLRTSSFGDKSAKSKNFGYFILLVFILSVSASTLKAQAPATIYKDWYSLGESKSLADISYRIVKCDPAGVNQIHLNVFNENPKAQTIKMTILIKNNPDNASFSKVISYNATAGSMNKAECSSSSATDDLKINLPTNYNPNQLTVTITFN